MSVTIRHLITDFNAKSVDYDDSPVRRFSLHSLELDRCASERDEYLRPRPGSAASRAKQGRLLPLPGNLAELRESIPTPAHAWAVYHREPIALCWHGLLGHREGRNSHTMPTNNILEY